MGITDFFDNLQIQHIYNSAMDQCERIDAAKAKCESAYSSIHCYLQALSENWQGESATAVYEKLETLNSQLQGIIDSLSTISETMCAQANEVNTEWPSLIASKMDAGGE